MKKKDMLLIGIGIGALAAAAVFFFLDKKEDDEKPPKNAPQVTVKNPGDQSEFTTSPSESEVG
jgi:hypothetical protein